MALYATCLATNVAINLIAVLTSQHAGPTLPGGCNVHLPLLKDQGVFLSSCAGPKVIYCPRHIRAYIFVIKMG